MMQEENKRIFVSCADWLESLLKEELEELGFNEVWTGFRGVTVKGDLSHVYRINYASRLASRVLWPIVRFPCKDKNALYKHAMEIDWDDYMTAENTFVIDANVSHPKLKNSLFAAQVVKDAICDHFREKQGTRPSVSTKNPDVRFNLFIERGYAVISFNTSGEPLFKRGYRTESVKAPLHETLAAALLRTAGYTGEEIVLDPTCGSGTLLIEAAMMATKTPPGYLRKHWGFFHMPHYSKESWLQVKAEEDSKSHSLPKDKFFGIDKDPSAIRTCKKHIKTADFENLIQVTCADFRNHTPSPSPSFIISNPPYGKRLDEEENLRPLYHDLGSFMKTHCSRPGKGFVFTGNLPLAKEIHLKTSKKHIFKNSGVECRLLEYDFTPRG